MVRRKHYAHITRYEHLEICSCPRCVLNTDPAMLRSDENGFVIGCSNCLFAEAK